MFAKAPTVAWLLAALTCFLAGMAVVEGRHQTVVLPVVPPVGVVVTVEIAFRSVAEPQPATTATPGPTAKGEASFQTEDRPHPEP
jgi:hypothetical protein